MIRTKIHSTPTREIETEIQNSDQIGLGGHNIVESDEGRKNDHRWRSEIDRGCLAAKKQNPGKSNRASPNTDSSMIQEQGTQDNSLNRDAEHPMIDCRRSNSANSRSMGWPKPRDRIQNCNESPMAELILPARDRQKFDD